MGKFNGTTLTMAGLALETKAQTGVKLEFTRAILGDGRVAAGAVLQNMTAMVAPKLELPIMACSVVGTGTARLQVRLCNTNLATDFFARELGIFARDPDAGEILYSYANAGDYADFIPAGGGADMVDLVVEVVTVVGRASNVTAVINDSLLFTTLATFQAHEQSTDPHPEFLSLGPAATDCNSVMVQQANPRVINPMGFDAFKFKVLGGDGSDLASLRTRMGQTERELDNIALELLASNTYPNFNARIAEDFKNPDLVDMFACAITSIVAGDDSIDVETLVDIVTGAWYTISDGVYQEACQIKSVVKNGSTYRLIMQTPIQNTYLSGSTNLYRTTSQIKTTAGEAEGAGDRRTALWQPATVWTGTNANAAVTAVLVTTAANASAFTTTGDIGYTADGMVTLV